MGTLSTTSKFKVWWLWTVSCPSVRVLVGDWKPSATPCEGTWLQVHLAIPSPEVCVRSVQDQTGSQSLGFNCKKNA